MADRQIMTAGPRHWSDVNIGDRFIVRVSRRYVVSRVVASLPAATGRRPGWVVRSESTGRIMEVHSPLKFLKRVVAFGLGDPDPITTLDVGPLIDAYVSQKDEQEKRRQELKNGRDGKQDSDKQDNDK